jgi:DNA-directed RNA polymerase specialized sigma24 family protein
MLAQHRLRRIAKYLLRGRRSPLWDTDGLVSEAVMKLLRKQKKKWSNSSEFFAAAYKLIRWKLAEWAKKEYEAEYGEAHRAVSLDAADPEELTSGLAHFDPGTVLDVHAVLDRLEEDYPIAHQVVVLRVFGRLTNDEVARELGVTPGSARHSWRMGLMLLRRELAAYEDQDE